MAPNTRITIGLAILCMMLGISTVYSDQEAKVGICHLTGSKRKPCIFIKVDESSVEAHLAHGDSLAKSSDDCHCQGGH